MPEVRKKAVRLTAEQWALLCSMYPAASPSSSLVAMIEDCGEELISRAVVISEQELQSRVLGTQDSARIMAALGDATNPMRALRVLVELVLGERS